MEAPDATLQRFQKEEHERVFKYSEAETHIKKLISDFKCEESKTAIRRKQRNIDVDVADLQRTGDLKADETFIPQREIDSNIRKEMPVHMGYLVQSRRLMIFEPLDFEPIDAQDVHKLEKDFTKGLKYSMWEKPHYKVLDGSKAHGWDYVEVEFDESKPLHVGIDHIGHDNLIFDLKARDIQACGMLLRQYELPKHKLMEFVYKYGFSVAEVLRLIEQDDTKTHFKVYKKLCKYNGMVYISWYAENADDWLLPPKPLFMGRKQQIKTIVFEEQQRESFDPYTGMPTLISVPTPVQKMEWQPVYESMYPIFILLYDETEQSCIADHKGRCFLDGPNQEARTAMVTVFVNGSVRASNVYGSPESVNPSNVGDIQKIDTTLEHGCFYNQKVIFWAPPYPDAGLLRGVDALQNINQNDTGQVSYAAMNRQDSRKTATEITAAQQQSSLLQTVDVIMFSTFLRELYNFVWQIVQSQAMQNLIKFAVIEQVDMMGQVTYINDLNLIGRSFNLKAAGDVDVVERAEKLNRRFNVWPVVQNTPLATEFFIDTIKEAFPEDADRYEKIVREAVLGQQAQQKQTMMKMGQMLLGLLTTDGNTIKPEYQAMAPQIKQLALEAQQSIAA